MGDEETIFEFEEELETEGSQPQGDDDDWEDLDAGSPEEQIDVYTSWPSPPDDLAAYNCLIKRTAYTYGVQLEEERQESCFLLTD